MTETFLTLHEAELQDRLLPRLRGRVFHVTCAANRDSIAAAGAILPNLDYRLPSSFGASREGFFRLRGCVSVFDYRQVSDERLEDSLWRCSPWNAVRRCQYQLAVYFLAPEACAVLESWHLWGQQEAWRQMVVPHVEAGHPGPISLNAVDELLQVMIEPHPIGWHEAILLSLESES